MRRRWWMKPNPSDKRTPGTVGSQLSIQNKILLRTVGTICCFSPQHKPRGQQIKEVIISAQSLYCVRAPRIPSCLVYVKWITSWNYYLMHLITWIIPENLSIPNEVELSLLLIYTLFINKFQKKKVTLPINLKYSAPGNWVSSVVIFHFFHGQTSA